MDFGTQCRATRHPNSPQVSDNTTTPKDAKTMSLARVGWRTVLIRPDGYMAWVGDLAQARLIDALTEDDAGPKG